MGPKHKKWFLEKTFGLSNIINTPKFKYLSELDVAFENTLGDETVAQGKIFDEKTRDKKYHETIPLILHLLSAPADATELPCKVSHSTTYSFVHGLREFSVLPERISRPHSQSGLIKNTYNFMSGRFLLWLPSLQYLLLAAYFLGRKFRLEKICSSALCICRQKSEINSSIRSF